MTTPTSTSEVTCSGSFSQKLQDGNYSIAIDIEDRAGNKAGPYVHQWVISKSFKIYTSAYRGKVGQNQKLACLFFLISPRAVPNRPAFEMRKSF